MAAAVGSDTALSPYAASLLRILTVPGAGDDRLARESIDDSRLSDRDLGALLPALYRLRGAQSASAGMVKHGLDSARARRQPVFTPESCVAMLSAIVDEPRQLRSGGSSVIAVGALLRCAAPLPEEAVRLARTLLDQLVRGGDIDHPYALSALAGYCGGLTAYTTSDLYGGSLPEIADYEVAVLSSLDPTTQALVAEVCGERSYWASPPLPDAWQRLAAVPEYLAYAHKALDAANHRVEDIQSGKIAYEADAAFRHDEVGALGRAVRVSLLHDEPWLKNLLRPLLLGIVVPPTAAKTPLSQALLYEVARAVERFPTMDALGALRAARAASRHKGVRDQLGRKLGQIERALGHRPELAFRLPDLGIGDDGVRVVAVGGHRAAITMSNEVELRWHDQAGRVSATVPAAVRRDHAEAVKDLRDLVKQVRGNIGTLVSSLEASYPAGLVLPYRRWRDELAANGLGWHVVRRLIWNMPAAGRSQAVLPTGDGFADLSGAAVAEPEPDVEIRLWHPFDAPAEEIQAWRDLLTDRELRQPFKQAFREVYPLTPAELESANYSNRFAAHIVHYRQLYALMRARDWTCSMLGPWDGGDSAEAHRVLVGGTWRIGFRHHYCDQQPDGIEFASTDRVWFERRVGASWRPASLAEVPGIVLSEGMRDVDLFVSVTSIAADPTWVERGDDLHAEYWREASIADLTATAQIRRATLERIIPRTTIADRCQLTERYLVVRGQLSTYRIHLGSANILMEPGDTYLCIVPSRSAKRDQVFLPFEDDRLTLILSKAFLLADDARITDPSIVAQLPRGRSPGRAAPPTGQRD
jgi:hypothetical protein